MTPHGAVRERYMRDEPRIRLGGLAANLARVQSFSRHPDHQAEVAHLIEQSAFFIEWTARDVGDDIQPVLADLQRRLVRWRGSWETIWSDPDRLRSIAAEAGSWSEQILKMSGLLDE